MPETRRYCFRARKRGLLSRKCRGPVKRRGNRTMGADSDRNHTPHCRFSDCIRRPGASNRPRGSGKVARTNGQNRQTSKNSGNDPGGAPSPLDPPLGFRVGTDRRRGPAARNFGRRDRPLRCAGRSRGVVRRGKLNPMVCLHSEPGTVRGSTCPAYGQGRRVILSTLWGALQSGDNIESRLTSQTNCHLTVLL